MAGGALRGIRLHSALSEDKEAETGFMYEPWHIRYLGVDLAQKITDSGLCLEEYLGITSAYAEDQ